MDRLDLAISSISDWREQRPTGVRWRPKLEEDLRRRRLIDNPKLRKQSRIVGDWILAAGTPPYSNERLKLMRKWLEKGVDQAEPEMGNRSIGKALAPSFVRWKLSGLE